jgi:hypothetical protein
MSLEYADQRRPGPMIEYAVRNKPRPAELQIRAAVGPLVALDFTVAPIERSSGRPGLRWVNVKAVCRRTGRTVQTGAPTLEEAARWALRRCRALRSGERPGTTETSSPAQLRSPFRLRQPEPSS